MIDFNKIFKIVVLIVLIIFGCFYVQINRYISIEVMNNIPLIIDKLTGTTYKFYFNQDAKTMGWEKFPKGINQ